MPELEKGNCPSAIKIVFPTDESFLRLEIDDLVANLPIFAQCVQADNAEFDLSSTFLVLHHPNPDKIPDLKKFLEGTRLGIEFLY